MNRRPPARQPPAEAGAEADVAVAARLWRAARGGEAVSAVTLYLGAACFIVRTFFAGWWFGEHVFGQTVIGLSIVLIGSMVGMFGFTHGLVKLIGAYTAIGDREHLLGALRGVPLLCLGASLALAAVGVAALLVPALPLDAALRSALVWAVVCVPVWTMILLLQHAARGFQRMGLANVPANIVHPLALVAVCLALPMFRTGPGAAAFFFQAYAAIGLALTVGLWLLLWRLPEVRALRGVKPAYRLRHWLWMSFPIGVANVQGQLLQRSDALILALFVTEAQVGIYGMAARLAVGVGQCKFAFSRYWAPVMAGRWEVRDAEGLQRVARRTARMSLAVSGVAAVALAICGRWVLGLPGEAYVAAYPVMLVMLAGQVFAAYYAPNVALLQMADQQRAATWNFTIALAAALAGYFALAPWAGMLGAAAVSSASTILVTWLMNRACVRRLRCRPGAF